MNQVKNRRIILLSLLFALVMCLSLAIGTLRIAHAEEDSEDVEITIASSAGNAFAKSTDTIFGEEGVEAWGCTGWGGFAAQLLTGTTYDVSAIKNTGKGALTFWLYLDNKDVVDKHKDMGGSWNLDVSSNLTYSDGEKVSYALDSSVFADARVGWQKVVVPLENPNENNSMNWTKFSSFRINTTGCGFDGGITLKVAGFTFTTTTSTKRHISGDPVTSFEVEKVTPVVGSAVPQKEMTIDELNETVTAYYPEGWGGYVSLLELKQSYSVMKLPTSALSVWVYFRNESDLSALSTFNVDVSSGDSYSDSHKYSFQLHNAFEMCKVGWNHVILPLETAQEKNSMDWGDVQNIRLNVSGGTACWVGTAKYEIIQSPYTELTVVGYVPPQQEEDKGNVRIPCDAETGLHIDAFDEGWSEGSLIKQKGFYKQGNGAWKLEGLGTAGCGKTLENAFNLSEYKTISFWLYVNDAAHLAQMADGQFELRSQNDDNHELNWSFKQLAATLHDGWNYVSLELDKGNKSADFNIEAVKYLRFYFVGLSGDLVTTIFDDLHAHKDPAGTLIEGFDNGWNEMKEVKPGHNGGYSTNFSGEGWSSNARWKFRDGKTVDIADYDMIGLWVYIGDKTTADAVAGAEIELSSSGKPDVNELAFSMPAGLKTGWQLVTFKISTGKKTGGDIDLTKVNFFGLVKTGLPYVTIYLDDLHAFESQYAVDPVEPIEKQTVVNADVAGVFNDTTLDNDEYQEGTGAAMTTDKVHSGVYTALFGPVNTGLELTGKNGRELGLALWLYLEDVSHVSSIKVTLSSQADSGFELIWTVDVSSLQSEWNWLTFKASEATRNGGVIDLTSVRRVAITFNGDSNNPITIGFDCVRIFNADVEGADEPVTDRRTLEPIDSRLIDACEAAWTNSATSETLKKQGYASVEITATESGALVTSSKNVTVGKTDLSIRPRTGNELGITFWLYVKDVEAITEIKFRLGSADNNYIEWTLSGLKTGWNWVTLAASAGSVTGTVDTDALTFVSITVSGNAFTVNIDRVTLINYTVAENLEEPAYEGMERNPVQEKIFIDCDTVDANHFTGNQLDMADMRQGTAAVATSGAGYSLSAKNFELGKTDLTRDTLVLAFWMWIEDITLYEDSNVNGQVELTSSGTYDDHELGWGLNTFIGGLKNGWNWVVLKGVDGAVSGGMPDFDNLNYFRIYVNNIAQSTLKLDRVTIGYIGNTALFSEPDWESEIAGAGEYEGANGSASLNPPYLETDFSNPDSYTYTETVSDGNGCGSVIAVEGIAIVAVAVAAGMVAVLLRKRKKND